MYVIVRLQYHGCNLVHAKKMCLLDQVNMVKVLRNVWGNMWINIKYDAFRIKLLSQTYQLSLWDSNNCCIQNQISELRARNLPHFPTSLIYVIIEQN